ncbi:hypothetical protein CU102_25910 [Phyllobacterium brassicacearum]|uniref:Uncharacterized protein n=1 Tax=Phyllobacterium brassicacearum TaxID=314235 RepID=A0A2P7B755_9HYPH|nr:hypothetical protein [Phyllobacterium brassicacearum]PSH62292.1 hypothetical protein CU102_25910 [Phyllobacterium brassicacearum]TDQ16723.1 hypothetical protein DEV91_1315 [Phyllobacterium brassicacearum]
MVLDFVGGVLLTAVTVFNLSAFVNVLRVSPTAKLRIAGVAGLWIGTQVSLAAAGAFGGALGLQVPLIGIMVVLPVLATAVAWGLSPAVRSALIAVPMELLIGLNIGRVFGAFFLFLAVAGRLDGPFPISAGWGDVITGLAALPLAVAVARQTAGASTIHAWNAFGFLDLVLAVGLGTVSFNGFVLQLIEGGVGSYAVQRLPWSMIPTILVPFYLIIHGIIFAQLREAALVRRQLRNGSV